MPSTAIRQPPLVFGSEVTPADRQRLNRQYKAVEAVMASGEWLTLREISERTGSPEASVSARLRDARRAGWLVEKQRQRPDSGTWAYRMVAA